MDIKAEKKEAARFLNQRGRRIDFVIFGLILIFVGMSPVFLYSYVAYLVSTIVVGIVGDMQFTKLVADLLSSIAPVSGTIIAILFLVFVTLPVMQYFFFFSYRMYRQGVAGKCSYFSGGSYKSALALGSISSSVLIVSFIPIIFAYDIAKHITKSPDQMIANFGRGIFAFVVILGIVLGFFVFLLFRSLFLFAYFASKGENVGEAIKKSCKIMKTQKAKRYYKSYIKSFLPNLLLALPTFLVLFFIDTLPKMMIVYYKLCDELLYGDKI